jgi:hypothetical protein
VAAVVSELVSPAWSSGAGVALRVHRGQAGPTLGLSLLYTSNDALSSASDLVVTWVGAALTVCPLRVSLVTSLWLEPCALAEGGRVRVSDRLVLRGRSVDRSWWSAGALARGGLELGAHIQLALELGLSAPLRERRFVLDNPEESVGHSPALSPLFALGASYGF